MKKYDPKGIEPKWQQLWSDLKLYAAVTGDETRPKFYMLTEFPYPSGAGLHAGHIREYTVGDVLARFKRMQGYNVLFPMGYDAFGLPTENYAIKHKIRPQIATAQNVATFRSQFDSMGFSYDWDREVNTTDPAFYRWTQWLFLKFVEAGLAYQAEIPINWCPKEKTGLSNEEVVDGKHERCGTPVEKKLINQWMLKITAYADRLIEGLNSVDYPSRIADQQVNWIGRSEGAEITWKLMGFPKNITNDKSVVIYTTRPDTLFGASFLVVSPEVAKSWYEFGWQPSSKVQDYIDKSLRESELARQEIATEKTGVDTGIQAEHPLTGNIIPVWVADYVLGGYGTGAVMAVPAHDERDFAFARTFKLPVTPVLKKSASKTKTALILHGTGGDNQQAWIPWLKTQLEACGYVVFAPNLPNADRPDLDEWLNSLKPYAAQMNENSLIIGHSLGAPTAEHFILRNKLRISKLLLVAPTFPSMPWEEYRHKYPNPSSDNIHKVSVEPVNWTELENLVQKITIFGSHDDPYISYSHLVEHARTNLPKSEVVEFESHGHFNTAAGINVLPESINVMIDEVYTGYGPLINSGTFDGLSGAEAKHDIIKALAAKSMGKLAVKYKLRDWIFSRQHYWGEPIPIIHCPTDGVVLVPEDQLPVVLPEVEFYEPTQTGESPLAAIEDWVNVACPKCGGKAKRETDTMPNWAGSSWYYLRYMDAKNSDKFVDRAAINYWKMVDIYLGGMEHTTLHLLYSRFWHQFLYDQGLVATPEPYAARRGQGIVLAADGRKMSKSIGNVVNPTDIIATHGADTLRLYILFMAPYDETTSWSEERLGGASRFVWRIWSFAQELITGHDFTREGLKSQRNDAFETEVDRFTHKTIKKIHDDFEHLHFNTAVSSLMEYVNFLNDSRTKTKLLEAASAALAWRTLNTLVQLLAPITPHIAEELWHELGWEGSVHVSGWPQYDDEIIKDDLMTIVVQVNGRVRSNLTLAVETTEAEIIDTALSDTNVQKYIDGLNVVKKIYVPSKLINFVVK